MKAIHFACPSYSGQVCLTGYRKDKEKNRLTIDLESINLILEKGKAPVIEGKNDMIKYSMLSKSPVGEKNSVVRRAVARDWYQKNDEHREDTFSEFCEVDGYPFAYQFFGEDSQTWINRPGYFHEVKKDRFDLPFGAQCPILEVVSEKPVNIFSRHGSRRRNDAALSQSLVLGADQSHKNERFVYFMRTGDRGEAGGDVVFRIKLRLDWKRDSSEEYRACFSSEFGRLFILRTRDFKNEFELFTIALQDLLNFTKDHQ